MEKVKLTKEQANAIETPEEIETEKERRWWARHGREVWELKVGDLVKCPIDSERKVFEIYEITEENTFYIRNINNKNDTIHTYGMLLEKYEKEPEQLTLF